MTLAIHPDIMAKQIKRVTGKCKGCGARTSVAVTLNGAKYFAAELYIGMVGTEYAIGGTMSRCACGHKVKLMAIKPSPKCVEGAEHKCSASCLQATNHICDCECGGEFHGAL